MYDKNSFEKAACTGDRVRADVGVKSRKCGSLGLGWGSEGFGCLGSASGHRRIFRANRDAVAPTL